MKAKAATTLTLIMLAALALGACVAIPPEAQITSVQGQHPAPVLETIAAAPAGTALQPPAEEVCNGMAQALAEAASRAASGASVEVTQSAESVPMTLPSASGTACNATANGTGEQFASPSAVMKEIDAVLTGGGWVADPMLVADGPTGTGAGYRSRDLVALASAIWLPDASANCPKDKPIPECKITPSQQLYTITLDTVQTVSQAPLQGASAAPAPKSNPASQNCLVQGGKPAIETGADGGQYSVCYFSNNYQCEVWALYRGECPVGGVKVTGYNTEAARYCAITGGDYTATGTTPDGAEAGTCVLATGESCDAWAYYNGYCIFTTQEAIGKPNPASENCAAQGGTLKIEQRSDVGQIGVCYFADNRQCEEWALARGDCPVGGVKVTGYNTEAARYCAITGGKYQTTGTTPDGAEAGDCTLPGGEVCDAWAYYNGYCGGS